MNELPTTRIESTVKKVSHNKASIEISRTTRDKLAILKYKNGFSTYEEIIQQLLGALA